MRYGAVLIIVKGSIGENDTNNETGYGPAN